MKAVIDTSSLILLAKAGITEQFINSVKEAIISEEVYREAVTIPKAEKKRDALYLESLVKNEKLKTVKVKNKILAEKIAQDFNMGFGEAETIALFKESKSDIVVTDDYAAIKACAIQEIPVVQAVGVVVRLYETKKINKKEANAAIAKLAKYGWYADWLIEDAKKQIGEQDG